MVAIRPPVVIHAMRTAQARNARENDSEKNTVLRTSADGFAGYVCSDDALGSRAQRNSTKTLIRAATMAAANPT